MGSGAYIKGIIEGIPCGHIPLNLTVITACAHTGLDVTGISESHKKICARIFVDDEQQPRTEQRLIGNKEAYKIPDLIEL